ERLRPNPSPRGVGRTAGSIRLDRSVGRGEYQARRRESQVSLGCLAHDYAFGASIYAVLQAQSFFGFHLFPNDPVNGDGIEQDDRRYIYGGDLAYQYGGQAYGMEGTVKVGIQTRIDDGRLRLGSPRHR